MKRVLIWIFAFVITLVVAYYQRITGPTYPVTDKFEINGRQVEIVYIRSHPTSSAAEIRFTVEQPDIWGKVFFRLYPTDRPYKDALLERTGDTLVAVIDALPPAGKMEYYIELYDKQGNPVYSRADNPVVIRYKGDVPAYFLIPHIFFMFFAIFLGIAAGLLALFDDLSYRKVQWAALISLLIGGFVFGPIVQKYAFGQLWTGIPFGWDLTDNKTLIMLAAWVIAIWFNRNESRRWWTVAAAVVQTVVYLIPHSLFGSTLNPETGEVTQGLIMMLFNFLS